MAIKKYLEKMIEAKASDMFLRVDDPARYRISAGVVPLDEIKISQVEMEDICRHVLSLDGGLRKPKDVEAKAGTVDPFFTLYEKRNYEGAFQFGVRWRFRVGIFFQQSQLAMVVRKIDLELKPFGDWGLPARVLERLASERRGLVLLTGITGSGKSTTIATLIEHINANLNKHILTIEEPVEFTFSNKKSLINQREIGRDVDTYENALKQFAMLSPDVIYIGQIRDKETMKAALTAAETGALVLSTIHSVNSSQTIERVVNFFPPHEQDQIRKQLADLIRGIISQRLVPRADGKGVAVAYEVLVGCPTVTRLVRDNEVDQIRRFLEEGDIYGMNTFDQVLFDHMKNGVITVSTAMNYADSPDELKLRMSKELDPSVATSLQ
jgi:twitching motility protein PilT